MSRAGFPRPKLSACWHPAARFARSKKGDGPGRSNRVRRTSTSGLTISTTPAATRWPTTSWSVRRATCSGSPTRPTLGVTSTYRASTRWYPPAGGSSTSSTRPLSRRSAGSPTGTWRLATPSTARCSGSNRSRPGSRTSLDGGKRPHSFRESWWPQATGSTLRSAYTRRSVRLRPQPAGS